MSENKKHSYVVHIDEQVSYKYTVEAGSEVEAEAVAMANFLVNGSEKADDMWVHDCSVSAVLDDKEGK